MMAPPELLLLSLEQTDLSSTICQMLSDRYTVFQSDGSELSEPKSVSAAIVIDPSGTAIDRWGSVLAEMKNDAPVLMVGQPRDRKRLIELLRNRVSDFVVPPLRSVEFLTRLERLTGYDQDDMDIRSRLRQRLGLRSLIGESDAFRSTINQIPLIARSDATVLLEGETGTGKEVIARAIHYVSSRSAKPFVSLNCAALPPDLLENELFGHEQGAYTDAKGSSHGLISEADDGTLLLDEIDSLPTMAQAKLLRFLQDKEYRPLGSPKTRQVDTRIIAASNCDMVQEVRSGRMREDFFYRLNVLSLNIPPLRKRHGDLVVLTNHFIKLFGKRHNSPTRFLSNKAVNHLLAHNWPGNVRELEHVIERAIVLADGESTIRAEHIHLPLAAKPDGTSFQEAKSSAVADWERRYLESLLLQHQGNISQAARAVKKNRRALWELLRKYKIDANRFRPELSKE